MYRDPLALINFAIYVDESFVSNEPFYITSALLSSRFHNYCPSEHWVDVPCEWTIDLTVCKRGYKIYPLELPLLSFPLWR